jgi:hypothetical protein
MLGPRTAHPPGLVAFRPSLCEVLRCARFVHAGGATPRLASGREGSLVYAIGVAISPVAIASVLLVLSSAHALPNAASFALGWIIGVAVVASVFVLVVKSLGISDSRPVWIGVLDLVAGAVFLIAAARLSLQSRPRGSPAWVDVLDRATAIRAATLGLVLSAANPKVFALALGAALALAGAGADAALTLSTVVLFTTVGATGVLAPIALYAAYRPGALHVWAHCAAGSPATTAACSSFSLSGSRRSSSATAPARSGTSAPRPSMRWPTVGAAPAHRARGRLRAYAVSARGSGPPAA